jgi:hypothetical protein
LAASGAEIAFSFLFVTFYGGCLDASSCICCSEIFPTYIRAYGVGLATSGVFLMNPGKSTYVPPFLILCFPSYLVCLTAAGSAFTKIAWKLYLVFIIIPA